MAELKKRVGSLKRELEVAQDMKPAELAGLRQTFISQDIVTATSQIEKIVLASQLARLSVQGQKQHSPAADVVSSTYHETGQKARQVDIQA